MNIRVFTVRNNTAIRGNIFLQALEQKARIFKVHF
jgi:hypothetical protein